jgi:peptidoglycan/LPS O-acetylase OafA/YrhL
MRDKYIDILRFLAIVRVVVYHATGWAFLTVVFPAMSVMFALAGSLMAASLDRCGAGLRDGPTRAVRGRLRRLLPSLWVLAGVFVPAMLLTGLPVGWRLLLWVVPLGDPPSNSWGALALSHIWYLRDYLWFVLLSPAALWLFRRAPLPVLLTPYAVLAVVEVGWRSAPVVVGDFGLYFGAWLLGFAHHDGLLRRVSWRVLVPLVVTLGATGLAWAWTHQGPRGIDLNDIRPGNALFSAAFTLLLLRAAPAVTARLDRARLPDRLVTAVNRRAVTVYLWHMPIVVGLGALAVRTGFDTGTPAGRTLFLLAVAALVVLAVLLFGWVEDVAARRRPALLPVPARPVRVPVPRRGVPERVGAAG